MPARKKEPKAKQSSSTKKPPARGKRKAAKTQDAFPIVGMGASAGGLEAF